MPLSREKHREYELARYHRLRNGWIQSKGGSCTLCGSKESLEIDHINRKEKSFDASRAWFLSESRRLLELAKCQVLCRSCHQQKTLSEISVPHGGGSAGKHDCRCVLCKKRRREYQIERRAKLGSGVIGNTSVSETEDSRIVP